MHVVEAFVNLSKFPVVGDILINLDCALEII